MGRRERRRRREGAGPPGPPASTTDYRDSEGNVLTLRDSVSEGTLRTLENLDAKPAASPEDRWRRRIEYLFERVAVRWEIAGLPLQSQSELLGRLRMASTEEKRFVHRTLADHLGERYPDLTV